MYFPLISTRSSNKTLYRRKGGGGGGKGGGGSSSGKGGSGSSSGSSSSSGGTSSTGRSSSVSSGGTTKSASSASNGVSKVSTIPSGQIFAGRSTGGGTRNQVYGNQQYGSGYPGVTGRGVAGRGFPFIFWPLAWGGIGGAAGGAYLHSREYGSPDNSSRPGGVMMTAAFNSSSQNTTFRLIADNTTVTSLIADIQDSCSSEIQNASSITAMTYNDSLTALPQAEQVVQYYRASTVALALDGYNDTAALEAEGTPDTPLPSNIDTNLLNCLNSTIGTSVPLIDSAGLIWGTAPPTMGLAGLAWVLWCISSLL